MYDILYMNFSARKLCVTHDPTGLPISSKSNIDKPVTVLITVGLVALIRGMPSVASL